ncbi:MAG TPA: ATPase, partial [Duganella sp.]
MPEASIATELATCESEPIRTPGSIQPHGFLLALSARLEVLQVSDNLADFTGIPAEKALGCPLAEVIGERSAQLLEPGLRGGQLRERPAYVATVGLEAEQFDVLAHAYDQLLVLEFERAGSNTGAGIQRLYPLVGDFLNKITDADTIAELSQLAATEIRALTGFGRVLVYSFDDEGHGNVLAESIEDGYDSYLGQRFPATDIPRQARELYLANRIRLIQNAAY